RGPGGDGDDVPVAAFAHGWCHELDSSDHAVQVDVDLPGGGCVRFGGERADPHDSGIVDQHIDRSPPVLDRGEEGRERWGVGDVQFECGDVGMPLVGEFRGCCVGGVEVTVADRHTCACCGEPGGDLAADSACAAGDGDDAVRWWCRHRASSVTEHAI